MPPGFDELVQRLCGHGLRSYAIASVLKVDPATVKRSLARSGRHDSFAVLARAVGEFRRRDGHFEDHADAQCEGRCLTLRRALGDME